MSAAIATPGGLLESEVFRRVLAWSAGAHVALGVAAIVTPHLRSAPPPAAIFVEIVASAAVPPRQVVDEPIVIPKLPKAKPEHVVAPPVAVVEPKPKPEPSLTPEQILALLRAKHAQPATPAASAGHARLDPETAAYRRKIENLIYTNWAGARAYRFEVGLEVVFEVEIDGAGAVRSVRLLEGSGKRALDESAERAIIKSAPFPPPPGGIRTITVRMNPRDRV